MLVITTPATDPNLLSLEQAKVALGIADNNASQDEALTDLIKRLSADIHSACRIMRGSGAPPTLRQETLTETIIAPGGSKLLLGRRHDIELLSLSVNGATQALSDCLIRSDAGIVERFTGVANDAWPKGKFVAVYRAGFAQVPPDLLGVATDLLKLYRSVESRDPLLKSERIDVDGVEEIERQFWVGGIGSSSSSSPLPAEMMARLAPYRNATFA